MPRLAMLKFGLVSGGRLSPALICTRLLSDCGSPLLFYIALGGRHLNQLPPIAYFGASTQAASPWLALTLYTLAQ